MIVFDDSYEHEAANLNDKEERVILLMDIWNPQIQKEEINEISNMFGKLEQMIKNRNLK
jgi:aspartyl/asparaginyl beta-hydroxylase (cupin superfamily)